MGGRHELKCAPYRQSGGISAQSAGGADVLISCDRDEHEGQYVGTCDSRDCACEGVKSTGEQEGCWTRRASGSGGAEFQGLQGVMEKCAGREQGKGSAMRTRCGLSREGRQVGR